MFGKTDGGFMKKQNFIQSPYAASNFMHWITINYRESYNIFACNDTLIMKVQ